MSNTILIKKSTTPNAVPNTTQLALGELAINTYDGRLFTKIDTGSASVFELTQNQPITVTGNVTGNSVNGVGNTTIDLTLTTTGVVANTYGGTSGATSNIGVFTVDQYGRITSASNVAISTSSLANGTSNIQIYANGNVAINADGTSNVAVFSNTGAYITGLMSVTGNISSGNIASGIITATGNITGGNIDTLGNVTANGVLTDNYYYANGAPVDFQQAAGSNTQIQYNDNNDFGASSSFTFDSANSELYVGGLVTVTGNVIGGNITTSGAVVTPNVTSSTGGLTIETASGDLNLWPTSGNIVVNTYINNLLGPQQATDAATKQYVDDAVSAGLTIHTPVYVESPNTAGSLNATYSDGGTLQTVTDITGNKTLTFGTSPGLAVNDVIVFSATSNGLVAGTPYFVYSTNGTNQVTLSLSFNGVEINTLTNGTGLAIGSRANSGVGATLTNAGANAALTIDGVLMTVGKRVLIYNQTNAYENGVYDVTTVGDGSTPWVLTRSSDTNTYGPKSTNQLDIGDYFFVEAGNTGAGESYVVTAPTGTIIFGTTNIQFTQFSASQVYSANTQAGLTLAGTIFSAKVDNDTTAFDGNGNIIVKAGANLVTPNIGAATGQSLSVTGNVDSGNVNTGLLSVTGNIEVANVNATLISATGNVDAGNLNTGGLASVAGNVIAGNIETAGLANVATLVVTNWANITGNTVSTSSTTGALIVAGGLGVAGNVYGGSLYSGGDPVLTNNSTIDGGTY